MKIRAWIAKNLRLEEICRPRFGSDPRDQKIIIIEDASSSIFMNSKLWWVAVVRVNWAGWEGILIDRGFVNYECHGVTQAVHGMNWALLENSVTKLGKSVRKKNYKLLLKDNNLRKNYVYYFLICNNEVSNWALLLLLKNEGVSLYWQ